MIDELFLSKSFVCWGHEESSAPLQKVDKSEKNKAYLIIRGGVLEDVLGLEDVLEDTFWSLWPQSLQVLKNALSSARWQYYFLIG